MRPRKICFLLAFLLCFLIGNIFLVRSLEYPVKAAPLENTVTVCSSDCAYTSIQLAINNAAVGNTILLYAETYTEPININKSITIQGMGDDQTIIQAATSPDTATTRVIAIQSGATVTITGVTIRYGDASSLPSNRYGGGIYSLGDLTLSNTSVTENSAERGSGIHCGAGTCILDGITIKNNNAVYWGGGLYINNTTDIYDSTIDGNNATDNGGGIYIDVY
ncbi:MAG: hypothetical protein J7L73_00125, partial [Anaerolineales bacterium]|nr:hypothetical protein [Anaerolineales bacterium]